MTELNIRESAKEYRDHGLVVFPVKSDGTKAPAVKWTQYKDPSFYTDEEFDRVFPEGSSSGLAVAWGDCSDGIFAIDIEYNDYVEKYLDALKHLVPELIDEIPMVLTPGKMTEGEERRPGMHLYFRCHDMTVKTQELTLLSKEEAKNRTGSDRKRTAIEIRGDGSYTLVPGGNPASHPTGHPYELISNVPIWDAPVLSLDQYDTIINIAKSMSEDDEIQKSIKTARPMKMTADHDTRPGTWYNESPMISMRDIISEYFTFVYSNSEGVEFYRRVGKDRGLSATYNYKGSGVLYVFTTSSHPFESGKSYSKLGAYAVANGLSYSEASKQIASHYREFLPSSEVPRSESIVVHPEMPEDEDLCLIEQIRMIDINHKVPLFPMDVLPPTMREYCEVLSDSTNTPVDFSACQSLAIASGAIGATRIIKMKDDHKEMCSLFMAIVASPGRGKSPVFKQVTKPLMETTWQLNIEYKRQKQQYQKDEELGNMTGDVPIPEEIHVQDFTSESLKKLLSLNPRGLTVPQDELTFWLMNMNRYSKGNNADISFYLDAWNGSMIKTNRKSDNELIVIKNPFITIFGGIQPGMLNLIASQSNDANGFSHRFLFCYPKDSEIKYYNFKTTRIDSACKNWNRLYEKIRTTFNFTVEEKQNELMEYEEELIQDIVELDKDAQAEYLKWDKRHVDSLRMKEKEGIFSINPYLKFTSHTARLALLLQSVWYVDCPVGGDTSNLLTGDIMEKAVRLSDYFRSHLEKALFFQDNSDKTKKAYQIFRYIKRKPKYEGKLNTRQLHQSKIVKNADEAREMFKTMHSMFLGTWSPETQTFTIDPNLDFAE